VSSLANWLPDYKQRYGDFTNPLPEENTIADYFAFVPQDQRPGNKFNFPVVVSNEHGQTADISGTAFTLAAAIDSVLQNAQLDGATLALVGNIPYDVTFRGRNGAGNGSNGGAFRTAFELKTSLMMQSMEFYRELSLMYGCGATTTLAADIGVSSAVSGANYAAPVLFTVSTATWAPGIWNNMVGGLVDVYATNGLTLRESGITVTAVNADTKVLTLTKAGSAVAPNIGDRIVPAGWNAKTCIGVEAILTNTGTLFGISAATYPMWKAVNFSVGSGALTRAKVLAMMARLFPNGLDQGGKLFVSAPTFADLAEEADALQRFTGNTDEVKRQGANNLEYKSPAGVVNVALHKYMKYGEAMFFPSGIGKRVGSTDITFRGEGQDWFFLELPTQAGCQLRCMSNQAVVLRIPYRCAILTNIVNLSV
jgi:hypothetical protein